MLRNELCKMRLRARRLQAEARQLTLRRSTSQLPVAFCEDTQPAGLAQLSALRALIATFSGLRIFLMAHSQRRMLVKSKEQWTWTTQSVRSAHH